MKIFDISRKLGAGTIVYPGNPKFTLRRLKTHRRHGSELSEMTIGLHTATHLDAPRHFLRNGASIENTRLERCVGWCRVLNMTRVAEGIGEADVRRHKPQKGEMLLFKTKNSASSTRFNRKFIHLTESGARYLARAGIRAVGTDGPSIRKYKLRPDTVHPLLFRAKILVYEGLDLRNIRPGRYYFIGVPLKIQNAEGSPVRAILIKT